MMVTRFMMTPVGTIADDLRVGTVCCKQAKSAMTVTGTKRMPVETTVFRPVVAMGSSGEEESIVTMGIGSMPMIVETIASRVVVVTVWLILVLKPVMTEI